MTLCSDFRNAKPLIVWRFLDGKPGHESQTRGLADALSRLVPVRVYDLPVNGGWRAWLAFLMGRCAVGRDIPPSDLLIGAGHSTHPYLLGCRRRFGGRVVVLMRPSVPLNWFDLCLIPEHDGVSASSQVLLTRGVLNPLRPSREKDSKTGLILVGGPSAHYEWDEQGLCAQIAAIAARDPRRWTVASSRRTPDTTLAALQRITAENLQVVPSAQTATSWLAGQLAAAPVAWVTEDSVSMLYEALTAGAACGVLPVPVRRAGRVRAGLQALLDDGVVCAFDDWRQGRDLLPPATPFDEAARCARWIMEKWFAS